MTDSTGPQAVVNAPDAPTGASAHATGAPGGVWREVGAGIRVVLPACVGVIPLGLAFGVLVVHTGFDWWWGPVTAAFVFAGSLEFLLIGLIAATAPLAQIAVTAAMVNFRHAFYALTFPLHRVRGAGWKAYSTFALTDEAYALTATPDAAGWSRAKILGIQAGFHVGWVGTVAAGGLVGTVIPDWIIGLDFAVTALFTVLAIEAFKVRRSLPLPVLALMCAVVAALISRENMLMIGLAMFTAALVVSYVVGKARRSRTGAPVDAAGGPGEAGGPDRGEDARA
ncbi:branched-chain amino acid ABC transporter permease [Pseudoclavibacter endophyticus]|uniref:AzlC family ABC transporter permease n=1 Tax=Pseudoclavibacter endophyticus TaxID=1778590 RepID=A0A6H9WHE2_9MICO|nr:AzlC family ABC transporter permease [Pseudoclavibacter endophyticus]KAB1650342.1 AzlC family ABC transporter permease [Pseudoclavibacter endophyticus]GGA54973.1 branched-chain amino acid ABC transporter permease [Pseudoclavibacter endophyticus]